MSKFRIFWTVEKHNGFAGSSYIDAEAADLEKMKINAFNEVVLHLIEAADRLPMSYRWNEDIKKLSVNEIKELEPCLK